MNHVTMLKLQVPFSMLLSGASGSGKTFWTYELLKCENVFEKKFDRIVYCYSQYQPVYDKMSESFTLEQFEMTSVIPWEEISEMNGEKQTLLIIDDQMSELCKSYILDACHDKYRLLFN